MDEPSLQPVMPQSALLARVLLDPPAQIDIDFVGRRLHVDFLRTGARCGGLISDPSRTAVSWLIFDGVLLHFAAFATHGRLRG